MVLLRARPKERVWRVSCQVARVPGAGMRGVVVGGIFVVVGAVVAGCAVDVSSPAPADPPSPSPACGTAPGDDACDAQPCGGLTGFTCDEGTYCAFDVEAACGAADRPGTCRALPAACPVGGDPVCGCDGRTYDTACLAAAAGVSAARPGTCELPTDLCPVDAECPPRL